MGEGGETVGEALRRVAVLLVRSPTPRLDARIILKESLGGDDAALIARDGDHLDPEQLLRIDALAARRASGEPISHILGRREFWGLEFKVRDGALAPRPDSETLIAAIVKRVDRNKAIRILDLGVGTGCLAGALLSEFPRATAVGVDRSLPFARLARENMHRLGFDDRSLVIAGSWADAVNGDFDVVISNPPYIALGEAAALSREVREFESPEALFAGADGLGAYRDVLAAARKTLAPKGFLVLEIGDGRRADLEALTHQAFPRASVTIEPDLSGAPRALVLERLETAGHAPDLTPDLTKENS